jgi:hypothetical protein
LYSFSAAKCDIPWPPNTHPSSSETTPSFIAMIIPSSIRHVDVDADDGLAPKKSRTVMEKGE